ncbi:MAG: CPBP family intramembrane metalloprotease [Propionibacterium sp.]|nr:CPBP family intramembrane metalloprotease [Propionibacterium sp.]
MLALPGLALLAICFWLARGDRDPLPRIIILLLGFILIRDAMTPAGLWEFGLVDGVVPWLRMSDNWAVLVVFGLGSLLLVAATLRDRGLARLVRWGDARPTTILLGIAGGALASAPVLAISFAHALEGRGGVVALALLPALAFFAFAGNLAEEVFFRGFLQGRLERAMSGVRAALLSGFLFAACHAFLATTVTAVGWPLLAFTLWEGLICAFLRLWRGVIPAAIAHGLAIFLLSSALI